MRVFQSISGHRSELSIANHSLRQTLSQLKCVSSIISNWNHRRQKSPPQTLLSFKTQMASRFTATTSFPRAFSQLLQYLTQRPSFSIHRASLTTKTDLNVSSMFLSFIFFVDFAAQFCFRCSSQIWEWRGPLNHSHNSLLRTATNEITLFCINNRSSQMAFFVFAKVGKGSKAGKDRFSKYMEINKALSLIVKQRINSVV